MKRIISLLIALPLLVATAFAGSDGNLGNLSFDWSGGTGRIASFYTPLTTTLSILTPPRAYPGTTGTFTRASAQLLVNDSNVLTSFGSGTPATNSKGVLLEPASTNKVTAYGVIPADTLGSNLAVNGGFDSDTDWTKGADWSIGSGVATHVAGTLSNLSQNVSAVIGRIYEVIYTTSNVTAGTIKPAVGGTGWGTTRLSNGTWTERITCSGSSSVYFQASADFVGSIDNVSIKEVQWAVGTKSYWTGSAWQQNFANLTLSGDTSANLSIQSGTTLVTNAGLSSLNPTGKIYQDDNTSGSAASIITIAGTAGNTNKHSGSIYVAKISGSGTSTLEINGTTTTITAGTLTRVKVENVTTASGSNLKLNTGIGDKLQFLLPDFEEQAACSSVKVTSGATATRAATNLTFPVSGNLGIPASILFEYTSNTPVVAGEKYLLGSYADANNSLAVIHDGTNNLLIFRKRVGGVNKDASIAFTPILGTTYPIGAQLRSDFTHSVYLNHVKGTDSADTTAISSPSATFKPGDDGNGANGIISGQIKNLKIYKKKLPDSLMYLDMKYRTADSYFMEVAA